MFSGFTNQMSSISSWIGSKKPAGQSQETSPQNPDGPTTEIATSPGIIFPQKNLSQLGSHFLIKKLISGK